MQDVRLAFRALRATPIVSAVAILSLALGIGANTAIFSLVDSLLLRTLPVKEPNRLVLVRDSRSVGPKAWPNPVWDQIHERPQLFDSSAAWSFTRLDLASGGEAQFVDGLWVSGSFFETLGVQPLLGRTLGDADDQRGGGPDGPVAVVSYSFWQQHFGGATDAIGRTLALDSLPFHVVGVTPPNFFGADVGRTFDVVLPLSDEPLLHPRESALNRGEIGVTIIGRLKPGQAIDAAAAELRGVQPQIREATLPENVSQQVLDRYLRGYLKDPFTLVSAATGNSTLRGRYTEPLLTILIVVAMVLLIACVNIANLMLARSAARRDEFSLRLALGASRWRIVRQLLAESVVLAGIGAVGGMAIAGWGSRLLVRQFSMQTNNVFLNNNVFLDLSIDWRVLAFTIVVAVATAMLFGTAPALQAVRVAPMEVLKQYGRGISGDARVGLSGSLIVAQVALSVALVVAAGLFVRTFVSLSNRNRGFDADRVLVATIDVQHAITDANQLIPLYERTREAVRSLPGVAEAALSVVTPVSGIGFTPPIEQVSGGSPIVGNEHVFGNVVSPGWFRTFGIPLIGGRDVTSRDRVGTPRVVIVNQAFARKFLNGADPLGHVITLLFTATSRFSLEIVGVVADSVYFSLRDPEQAMVYVPLAQWGDSGTPPSVSLSVRPNGGPPALLTKAVTAAIGTVNPKLALTFRSLNDQVNDSLARERVLAMLAGFFGALALLLAGLGLYGVTTYSVIRRRTEIGIRIALGATPIGVVRLVLSRVSRLVGMGVLSGAGLSLWASKFVALLLYGLEPRDPATLVGAGVTLAVVGAVAGWLAAWRASRIDPAEVLRES